MELKGYQKGAQSGQNGTKGTESIPKGINKKEKIRKGRFRDTQPHSEQSAPIAIFQDLQKKDNHKYC